MKIKSACGHLELFSQKFTHVSGAFALPALAPVGVGHEPALSRAILGSGGPRQVPVGELDEVAAVLPADFEDILHVPFLELERVFAVDGQSRRSQLGSPMDQHLIGTFEPKPGVEVRVIRTTGANYDDVELAGLGPSGDDVLYGTLDTGPFCDRVKVRDALILKTMAPK